MAEAKIKKLLMQRSTLYKDAPPEVVQELDKLSHAINLDAKQIVGLFDKYMTVNRQGSDGVSIDDVFQFSKEQKLLRSRATGTSVFAKQEWDDMDVASAPLSTSVPSIGQKISPYLSRSLSSKEERSNFVCQKGAIHASLNSEMRFESEKSAENTLEVLSKSCERTYMMNGLIRRAQYLEQRLENFEMAIAQEAGLAKLQPLASASQMVSVYCGRICCDTEEGKINLQSITLEGSLATSKGARVKVDISACTSFRLFPGQIVAIIGTNPSGFCIVAKEILSSFAPDDEQNANMEPVDMVVACGPFTTSENLYYEPLQELLEYCIRTKPDCLLLLGPFVDAEHPEIKQGMAEVGYDDLFHDLILAKLAGFHDSHGVKIILMPSTRDVQHEMVIPQIPMEVPGAMFFESLQNPCTFRYKGSVFGCSSLDWLMSATREEISKSADPVDRLTTLSLHLLNQKSYYPMYPPSENIPLDTSRAEALDLLHFPHVLLSPSDLVPFAKIGATEVSKIEMQDQENPMVVRSKKEVVCVNPGRLTKGDTAGTFAHIYINRPSITGQSISERCKVEICKL